MLERAPERGMTVQEGAVGKQTSFMFASHPVETPNPPRFLAWNDLPAELQLHLARAALNRAAQVLAEHACLLAEEVEAGHLDDDGGPAALRLFAQVVRQTQGLDFVTVGNA